MTLSGTEPNTQGTIDPSDQWERWGLLRIRVMTGTRTTIIFLVYLDLNADPPPQGFL